MRRSSKLFVALLSVVLGLALSGQALASSGSQSQQLRMHINDGGQLAMDCPTASQDSMNFCGHLEPIPFSAPGTYTVSVTVDCSTYPSSAAAPCDFQVVTPTLCQEGQAAVAGNCPVSSVSSSEGPEAEANCGNDSTLNADGSTTYSISCLVVAGIYELLIVPNAVDTCPEFDILNPMPCGPVPFIPGGPGVDVIVTTLFTPNGTLAAEPAKAKGTGQVGDKQKFHFQAWNDPSRYSKTKVRFQIKTNDSTRCTFSANSATSVVVTPDPLTHGGTVKIDGQGTVTDSLGHKTTGVLYHVDALDAGGHGGTGDMFQLTAAGCSNANPAVTHGKVEVDPAHGPKNS